MTIDLDKNTEWSRIWPTGPLYLCLWGKMGGVEQAIYEASETTVSRLIPDEDESQFGY